jgi:hypothetical protein
VLHTSRHDEKLALFQHDGMIAEFHPEPALNHQEEFIFGVVVMPDEWTLKLHQLDLLAVQLTNNFRLPVCGEQAELFAQVYFPHVRYYDMNEIDFLKKKLK